jgi:hypothetical protein
MRSRYLLCGALVTACGGGASSTPEAAVRAAVAAVNDGDVKALIATNVPPERLLKALSCAKRPSIVDQMGTRVSFLEQRPDVIAGLHVELGAVTIVTTRSLAKGETFHDCTANEAFDVASYRVEKSVTEHGATKHVGSEDEAIKLDGHWYLL